MESHVPGIRLTRPCYENSELIEGDSFASLDDKMSTQVKEGVSQGTGEPVKVAAKKHRWYLGGIASAMAACCTHPLDLLKVRKQFVIDS